MNSVPLDVLRRFYTAEAEYMRAGGPAGGADFADMAATLHPEVVLHQSPDLPWGGDFHGHVGYEEWARKMSAAFDQLDVEDPRYFVDGDTIVVTNWLVVRARRSGIALKSPMTHVVKVKEGLIVEFRPFYWNVPAFKAAIE